MEEERSRQVGYVELLRTYPTFAKYFFANILSTTGTWFTTIALFVLAAEVSGLPELAVGLVLVLRMFAPPSHNPSRACLRTGTAARA